MTWTEGSPGRKLTRRLRYASDLTDAEWKLIEP